MADDPLTIGTATERRFYVRCSVCPRRGRYRTSTLVKQFGADFQLPGLARAIATWRGCEHVNVLPLQAGIACGAQIDLAAMYLELKREIYEHKHRR